MLPKKTGNQYHFLQLFTQFIQHYLKKIFIISFPFKIEMIYFQIKKQKVYIQNISIYNTSKYIEVYTIYSLL